MNKLIKFSPVLLIAVLLMFSFGSNKKVIVIDAGHGGKDNGASYDEFLEKNIVLSVASKIKKYNENSDIEIILTRDDDAYPSLSERTDFINKLNPDLVISIHVNRNMKKETDAEGAEIYYSDENSKAEISKNLAEKLSLKMGNAEVKKQNLHILRNSNVPAILVELGFISNEEDRKLLTSENGQNQFAKNILDFLNNN